MKILDLMEAIDEGSFNQMAAAAKDIQRGAGQTAKDQALSDKWAARKAAPAPQQAAAPAPGSLAGWQKGPTATTQEPAPSEPIPQQQAPAPAEQPQAEPAQAAAPAPEAPAEQPTAQEPEAPAAAPAPKGPGVMSKVGGALKGAGNLLGKAADAAPGVLNKVGNVTTAAADAAGRTVGGALAGYNYARHGTGQQQQPGQRTDAPMQQGQAPQQQAPMQQAPAQQSGAPNFNNILRAIPKLSANQKAQVAKAVGVKGAPPAPKVVQGGKPAMAVAESVQFYSNFLGRTL